MNKAILVTSFGTAGKSAINTCILPLERAVAAAFPDWRVFRCFTSEMIIRRLSQQNVFVDSLDQMLERLTQEGCTHVAILPTLLTDGGEYAKIMTCAAAHQPAFAKLSVAKPLLADGQDINTVADIIRKVHTLNEDEALLLMGHGTVGSDNRGLCALADKLQQLDGRIFLAALNGAPDFAQVLRKVCETGCRKVTLAPLMITAGTHVQKHLSGHVETSWQSQCRATGLETNCHLVGLGEYPEVRELYLGHLSASLTEK